MADFDPRELDQLEDALAGLCDPQTRPYMQQFAEATLPPELCERLADYQAVLDLCDETFPNEEPSDAVLAGVLAEARAVSRPPHRLRDGDRSAWRRFWDRWRGTVVPAFALAGTAAAVLWVLEPVAELEPVAQTERVEPEPEQSGSERASEPRVEVPKPTLAQTEREATEPTLQLGAQADASTQAQAIEQPVAKRKAGGAAPPPTEPKPGVAPEPMSKEDTWDNLERANAERRKGECDRARPRYQAIIAASSDSLAVARAKAGVGLCLEQERRSSDAEQWFKDARSDQAGIDAWISNQRSEQPLPSEIKPSKASKKSSRLGFE